MANFKDLEIISELYGADYKPLLKLLWYYLLGLSCNRLTFSYGNIKTDARIHTLLVLPSGFGKKNFCSIVKRLCAACQFSYEQPTTYHPEQLVGKVLNTGHGKSKQTKNNYGFMFNDALIFDEGTLLLHGVDDKVREARSILSMGMDPYPDNMVTKRSVDTLRTDALSYSSPFCLICLSQPLPYEDSAILRQGFLRRFLVGYVSFDLNRNEQFRRRLNKFVPNIKGWQEFLCHCHRIETFNPELDDDLKNQFLYCHDLLIQQGRAHSETARGFIENLAHSLEDELLKISCLLAISHGRLRLSKEDIIQAHIDSAEFLQMRLDYVDNFFSNYSDQAIKGVPDYGVGLISSLIKNNAISEETSTVSIASVLEVLSAGGYSERSSRRLLKRLVDLGYVKKRQTGQYESKVWLTQKALSGQTSAGALDFDTFYYKSTNKLKNTTPTGNVHPVPPVPPEGSKNTPDMANQTAPKLLYSFNEIVVLIKEHDLGEGVTVKKLLEITGIDEMFLESGLRKLSHDGDIFECRPGKWKVL